MNKFNQLLLMLCMTIATILSSCAIDGTGAAERALRAEWQVEGCEVKSCQLVNVGKNTYQGNMVVDMDMVRALKEAKGEISSIDDLRTIRLMSAFLKNRESCILEFEFDVKLLYDGKTLQIVDKQLTEQSERKIVRTLFGLDN